MLRRWNCVVYANTIPDYERTWSWFKTQYSDPLFDSLIAYIQCEWLDDCSERFLHCYTGRLLHLMLRSTSSTESAYWLLKQDLGVSTNDLSAVLQCFERAVKLQSQKIKDEISQ